MSNKISNIPPQKIADSAKTKKWFKQNIDAVDNSGFFLDEGIRASYKNRKANYDLYNGILNMDDVVKVMNPNDLKGIAVNSKIQHYPIAVPRINVLIGEELKRRFDFKVIITNPDSVSAKEEDKLNMFKEHIMSFLESNYEEKELEQKLKDLEEYSEMDWQDYRELLANNILRHLYQEQQLDLVFNDGFMDALLAGEEYYITEIVSGEPVLRRLNTDSVHWMRSGFSNKIEDADLIVIDEYWSPGRIVDTFHSELLPSEIDSLEKGYDTGGAAYDPHKSGFLLAETKEEAYLIDSLVDMAAQGNILNRSHDSYGNLRVLRVYWRSFRKIKKVKYYDEFGDEQYEYYPDSYVHDPSKGETVTSLWINEWLEGTKIGNDIYVNMRPKPIQYHKLDNPSYCHPGITGKTYSIGTSRTVSLMDRMKKYQYLYDVIFDRLNKLIANNKGKVLEMDFSIIPEEWEPEQWFTYLSTMNIAVKDSFREGAKGAATGRLAANLGSGTGHNYIDLDQSEGIQNYIALLQFLKTQMSEISGVSDQRLGQIENRETIGGVERSITQSSHITEWYFYQHEKIKLEALRLLLDTAKIAFKGKNKKVQFILDEQSIQMLNIDGEDFSSHEYGLVATTSPKTQELDQTIREGAYALMNRGELPLSTLIELFSSNSLSEKRKKIEKGEKRKSEEDARRFDEDLKSRTEAANKQYELEMMKLELEDLMNMRDNETKLMLKGEETPEEPEDNSLEVEKFDYEKQKNSQELTEKKRQFDEKLKLEYKKVASKPKTN